MLFKTYWANNRSLAIIKKSIANSICFGVYNEKEEIGFARVVTDKVVFTWIMDLIIEEKSRGKGLGDWLIKCILNHPDVKNTEQFLSTKNAHGLYEKYGFKRTECMKNSNI